MRLFAMPRNQCLSRNLRYVAKGMSPSIRVGFTLLELLAVVGIIGLLVMLLLPAVQAAREAARRMSCSNNVKQVSLGIMDYHDAFKILPPHGTGTYNDANSLADTNQFRLSFLVSILPFIEQQPIWNSLIKPVQDNLPADLTAPNSLGMSMMSMNEDATTHSYPAMGSSPLNGGYQLWNNEISVYRCPSDPGVGLPSRGRTNYVACLGDAIEGLDEGMWRYRNKQWQPSGEATMQTTGRGVFVPRMVTRLDDITDGLSNTIMIGEINTDLGDNDDRTAVAIKNGWRNPGVLDDPSFCTKFSDPIRPQFWLQASGVSLVAGGPSTVAGRGYLYADFAPLMSGMNTILPPNRELCFGADWLSVGTAPPSSRHPGGCHIGTADGSVRFITDSIEAGNSTDATVVLGGQQATPPAEGEIDSYDGMMGMALPQPADRNRGSQSNYGLWGAMGTRNGNEVIDQDW